MLVILGFVWFDLFCFTCVVVSIFGLNFLESESGCCAFLIWK